MWINTKVEFEWDGEKYVEVHSEGYEYAGILDHCLEEDEGGGEGPREREVGEPFDRLALRPWVDNPEQGQAFYDWLLSSGVVAPQLRDRITNLVSAEELIGAEKLLDAWKNWYSQAFPGDDVGDDTTTDDTTGDTTGDDDPNTPTQVGEKWMDSAGNLWASYEEAFASNVRIRQAEEERAGRVADFETRFAEYEKLIEEGSTEEKALAQRMSARMRGQLQRRIEDSILATGGEVPEGFEERLAETSTRQLLDITSNIEQRRIAQLTGAKQFEIGTSMSLEQIETQETGLEQQMYQFLSTQAQREAQFEGTMGFQQAELALRRELGLGQLGLSRDQIGEQRRQFDVQLGYQLTPEEQMKMAKWGAFGQFAGTLGSFALGKWGFGD